MPRINAIGSRPAVRNAIREMQKRTSSGLPKEMPLDDFRRETEIINKLDPATPYQNALNDIENQINMHCDELHKK